MKTHANKSKEQNKSSHTRFIKSKNEGFFTVQKKLTIGKPKDKYEVEADKVADAVVFNSENHQNGFLKPASNQNIQKCSGCFMQEKPISETISPVIQKEGEKELAQMQQEEEEMMQMQPEEEEEMLQAQPLEEEEEMMQPKRETIISGSSENGLNETGVDIENKINSSKASGNTLDVQTKGQMESSFGRDFSKVKVHTDNTAVELNQELGAHAFTTGNDIFFNAGKYKPKTKAGKHLLAHELTHTIQQNASNTIKNKPAISSGPKNIQRTVQYDVIDWSAAKLGPPVPQNSADQIHITIPPTGQIQVSSLVNVTGDPGDACASYEIGTTQTAWVNWIIMDYRGATPVDGSMTLSHRAPMPMRDPAPGGDVWYDLSNVRTAAGCGSSAGIFHFDSPWHNIPKAQRNTAVPGRPLNYLRRYRRGLHLVTYLTARDARGNFLRRPLRFVYWNSIQNFGFTPQLANMAATLGMWPYSGQVNVNIGTKGRGVTSDAPYYRTGGLHYNTHMNTAGNWRTVMRRR